MNANTEKFFIATSFGRLECALDRPLQAGHAIALVAHPHPLFGGAMDNKVVHTLVRSFIAQGFYTFRMNFRGVGASSGTYDNGSGETDDMQLLLDHAIATVGNLPLALAGFSFGAYVQTYFAKRLAQHNINLTHFVLVGTPCEKWALPDVPQHTLLVHGEKDETCSLQEVYNWQRAYPEPIAVTVLPGTDHFFHQRLQQLRVIVSRYLQSPAV